MAKKLTAAAVVILSLSGGLYALYSYYYPLGRAHRCDTLLWLTTP